MNILILGHRQHGKTLVGKLLAEKLDVQCMDSSVFALEHIVYPTLKEMYGYIDTDACHADRVNHRAEWFNLIEAYNNPPDRMTRDILEVANIYVGMRSRMEFEGSKHHFDHIIWVDASDRVPLEDPSSMKLYVADANWFIDNNHDLDHLNGEIENLSNILLNSKTTQDNL